MAWKINFSSPFQLRKKLDAHYINILPGPYASFKLFYLPLPKHSENLQLPLTTEQSNPLTPHSYLFSKYGKNKKLPLLENV